MLKAVLLFSNFASLFIHLKKKIMKQTMPINGKFSLAELPYAPDALEPVINAETINYHYGKHLQAYVNNLNALLPGSPFENLSLEEIVRKSDGAIFNNAGQILNHNLYFSQFATPKENNTPSGRLETAIKQQYGSFNAFREAFENKGSTLFGSGWVWLSRDQAGTLKITQEHNAENPLKKGLTPLLTFDVWEHAYYLDYQNRRAAYLAELWKIIDWEVIEQRY